MARFISRRLRQSGQSDPLHPRRSKSKQSAPKLQRLKSRKRQQFQNERLGIKLVTDMTRFRKGPQHVAQIVKPSPVPSATGKFADASATGKFADASALRALEGSPSSASMGNWAWLRNNNNQSPASATPTSQRYLSPEESKIVIGMSMSEDDAASRTISPSTATVATPTDRFPPQPTSSTQPRYHLGQASQSAWSPDTEDGWSPARHPNIYAQSTGQSFVPPVPAVPSDLKKNKSTKASLSKNDFDDDNFTPVTLFEEDGKSPQSALSKISPETTRSRSGWWDHVSTPFKERFSPSSARSAKEAASPDEWWKGADEKKPGYMAREYAPSDASASTLRPVVPIIREPSPTIASSSRASPPPSSSGSDTRSEKAGMVMADNADPSDVPPPYERTPSSEKESQQPVRFRAVFPPNHPLANQFPPSPMPGSPGLDRDMSSKGDIKMSDVPLTPALTGPDAAAADAPLPDRVAGTYVGDQFQTVHGDDPAAKVEKTRRRHEKEDVLARKVGGFWKGRGCLPEEGCYGRSGREGRQRRRLWLFICLAFWLLTILGVVLGVVLSRSDNPEQASVWLNLTDFPAIPTGLATVVGPDNSEAITGCVEPASLWSCSLPPEQQAANEPSDADQPTFIFQIQYDNNTRELWDIPNSAAPTPTTTEGVTASTKSASSSTKTTATTTSTTSSAASATATDALYGSEPSNKQRREADELIRRDTLYDTGIAPNPAAPSYDDMWFLGNWTDGIVSANKSGEPTPFYISFFTNVSSSAGPNMLTDSTSSSSKRKTRRDSGSLASILPAPMLNPDGTGATAQLHPYPFQQPLRLYDRGLDTEHYGFYSYFNKTIYVSSIDNTSTADPASGGVLESSASWYVTWTQTRFVVKIWTRKTNGGGARLIGSSGTAASSNTTSPGSFPYPITIGEDTHGGNLQTKYSFALAVEENQVINRTDAQTFANNIAYGSPVVNPAFPDGDLSWGGTDGGTGGCRCEWVNWVKEDGSVDTSFG
ncbi:hypothetical protein M406DRAFT_344922 [Cryphonectria parasitica EP155]|uniref:Glycoprotease family protein n=1 Tax=Cryphonectria parasitica (strain ATCC 38755 / EP155) TaxID=660469 RepID=A0A9P4YAE6_CRYP1|nr:uncharacterized protein M406DRAFT_344922 [Cryphonectria parasitica EP155]KAF3769035.1 hypothetical protein M406DRAFT_344922 [Cryphonectria parasitica EP155]